MIHWKVKLSNGESYTEGNFPYEFLASKKTPWLRLKEYLQNTSLEIISLQLISANRSYYLPGSHQPQFNTFRNSPVPLSFDFYRVIGIEKDGQDAYTMIEARFENYNLQLWVDDFTKDCWSVVQSIKLT